jgi:hypothetical protein
MLPSTRDRRRSSDWLLGPLADGELERARRLVRIPPGDRRPCGLPPDAEDAARGETAFPPDFDAASGQCDTQGRTAGTRRTSATIPKTLRPMNAARRTPSGTTARRIKRIAPTIPRGELRGDRGGQLRADRGGGQLRADRRRLRPPRGARRSSSRCAATGRLLLSVWIAPSGRAPSRAGFVSGGSSPTGGTADAADLD